MTYLFKRTDLALVAVSAFLLTGCGAKKAEDDPAPVVDVNVAKVERGDVANWLDVFGAIAATPPGGGQAGGMARLTAPGATIIRAIPVHEGQKIAAGTLVARLDDRIAAAGVAQAQATARMAGKRAEQQEQLLGVGGIARNTLDDTRQQLAVARTAMAAAQAVLSLTRLASPLSGTVAKIYVQPGQAVDANTPIADVVNDSRLSLTLNVPAGEASGVSPGQVVQIIDQGLGRTLSGTITFVSPSVDPATASVMVRATVSGGAGLQQGRTVSARIQTARHEHRLLVPTAALYTDNDGKTSLALVRDGVAHRVEVKRGISDGDRVEVEGPGLTEGSSVVTTGSYALADGTRVHIEAATGAGQ
ncbi:efflux RND transporter periplasmic adaptor subunit [Novosphingobium rosa]|uniref:efflux RND transporter periplasmic adaptor subunit n=1 Tax=Novosphingobium rosa TaxID=76978 RepID=UPI00082F9077|nr:efflux RND transporter periplasmic adaptor subunit [Novosphingobium rosa]